MSEDLKRYSRNIRVEGFGEECQRKLLDSSVLIIGCGALGSVVATYLGASGVGRIGLADHDNIELTNLQRQIMFTEADCGKSKAETLSRRLKGINHGITVEVHKIFVTPGIAMQLFSGYDFIIDATDNPSSKYMIDEVCEKLAKPCCIAGVSEMKGQVATYLPGGIRFKEQFPIRPEDCFEMPCQVKGVIGPIAGVFGSLQALEAIKYLSGYGAPLSDSLLAINVKENLCLKFS